MMQVVEDRATPVPAHRGRPKNPYAATVFEWQPGATAGWLGDEFPILRNAVDLLILSAGVPCTTRWLYGELVWTHRFNPRHVSITLAKLRSFTTKNGTIVCTRHEFPGDAHPANLYTWGRVPRKSEVGHLADLVKLRQEVFNKNAPGTNLSVVGTLAEVFVARVLSHDPSFYLVTKPGRVGTGNVDIFATERVDGGTDIRFGVEVKNVSQILYANKLATYVNTMKAALKDHPNVRPWIVAPYISKEGKAYLTSRGVRWSMIGAQILPATHTDGRDMQKTIVPLLRPVIGSAPIHTVKTRYDHEDEPFARRIVATE